jgi:hypothetical protein
MAIYRRRVCLQLQPVQSGELVEEGQVAPGLACRWVDVVNGKAVQLVNNGRCYFTIDTRIKVGVA